MKTALLILAPIAALLVITKLTHDRRRLLNVVRDQQVSLDSNHASKHIGAMWDRHKADVLVDAAKAWDSPKEHVRVNEMARTRYQPGGSSMPTIWLLDRAAMVRESCCCWVEPNGAPCGPCRGLKHDGCERPGHEH